MTLTHYSNKPLSGPIKTIKQNDARHFYEKPHGLWVSVDGNGDGWADWCRGAHHGLDRLTHVHEVRLRDTARVLLIENEDQFDAFARKYSRVTHIAVPGISWEAVAAEFDGIIIAPVSLQSPLRTHVVLLLGLRERLHLGCAGDRERHVARGRADL